MLCNGFQNISPLKFSCFRKDLIKSKQSEKSDVRQSSPRILEESKKYKKMFIYIQLSCYAMDLKKMSPLK